MAFLPLSCQTPPDQASRTSIWKNRTVSEGSGKSQNISQCRRNRFHILECVPNPMEGTSSFRPSQQCLLQGGSPFLTCLSLSLLLFSPFHTLKKQLPVPTGKSHHFPTSLVYSFFSWSQQIWAILQACALSCSVELGYSIPIPSPNSVSNSFPHKQHD